MKDEAADIHFTLIYAGKTHQVQTSKNEHYSLMTLISDILAISGFGLCCGMGSCGTCLVYIFEKNSNLKRSYLACDLQINSDLKDSQIFIPEDF